MGFSENCTVPCTSTRIINRKHISETVPYSGFLDLRIAHTYEKLIEKKLSLSTDVLISIIGGNIGFWLGVSIIVKILSLILSKARNK